MPSITTCMSNGTRSSPGTHVAGQLHLRRLRLVHRRQLVPRPREVRQVRLGLIDRIDIVVRQVVRAARLRHVHPGPAHLLQRRDLADHHLRHPRRAQVHRRVALDHEDDVAERRDVRPTRRRRPEQAADLRHLPRQPHLVVEDPPRAAPTREQLHLIRQPRPGRVHQPDDRDLLGQRRLRGAHHLLDRPCAPRPRLHHRVVGHDDRRHPLDRPAPRDDAVRRQPGGHGVRQHASSTNEPSSSSRSMRSRAVNLP